MTNIRDKCGGEGGRSWSRRREEEQGGGATGHKKRVGVGERLSVSYCVSVTSFSWKMKASHYQLFSRWRGGHNIYHVGSLLSVWEGGDT